MSNVALEVEKQVKALAALLTRDGLGEEAATINNLHGRRLFFWDQMALRVSDYLAGLLVRNGLAEDTKRTALDLQRMLKPFTTSPYDEFVYTPAKRLGADMEKAGFPGWERKIADEIACSFTAGEIFDVLRYELNGFLNKTPNVPAELERKIRQFVKRLR